MVVLGLGFFWLREHDRAVRAEAESKVLREQNDSLRVIVKADSLRLLDSDLRALEQQATIRAQQAQLDQALAAARNTTAIATAALRDRLSEDLRPLLDSITQGFERQLAIKDSVIATHLKSIELEQGRVASRDTTIAALRTLNASIEKEVEALRRQKSPSLLKRAGDALPFIVAAYFLGRGN